MIPSWVSRMFLVCAIVNWVATAGAVVSPAGTFAFFFHEEIPLYPFMLRAWSGMAFMFGFMFLEISRDPIAKAPLVKYAWLEKLISALSVTIAFAEGTAPTLLFCFIIIADWLWIPMFIYASVVIAKHDSADTFAGTPA